jgi:hypothetical protein
MRLLSGFSAVLVAAAVSFQAVAHESGSVGEITTNELKLTYIDHVLSGAIGTSPVYAYPLPDQYGIFVQHHAGSEMFTSEFKKSEGILGGKFKSRNSDGAEIEATVVVQSVNAEKGSFAGTIDQDPFEVRLSANEMSGHHYIDPHFVITVADKTYEFDLKKGQACMGCAVKIGYVILGLMRVNGLL